MKRLFLLVFTTLMLVLLIATKAYSQSSPVSGETDTGLKEIDDW